MPYQNIEDMPLLTKLELTHTTMEDLKLTQGFVGYEWFAVLTTFKLGTCGYRHEDKYFKAPGLSAQGTISAVLEMREAYNRCLEKREAYNKCLPQGQ